LNTVGFRANHGEFVPDEFDDSFWSLLQIFDNLRTLYLPQPYEYLGFMGYREYSEQEDIALITKIKSLSCIEDVQIIFCDD
jgi:hypothetical protein